MVTFFTENDLVSFGNYLLSKERREDYAKQLEADKISAYLSQVNQYDLQVWIKKEVEIANAPRNTEPPVDTTPEQSTEQD